MFKTYTVNVSLIDLSSQNDNSNEPDVRVVFAVIIPWPSR